MLEYTMDKKLFRHKISSGEFINVFRENIDLDGLADHDKRCFYIHTKIRRNSQKYMDTLIHELIHLELPEMIEEEVEKLSNSIARLIWKAGYRKHKSGNI